MVAARVMIVDVIKAFSSGLEAPFFRFYNGLAEAAPEPALAVATDSAIIKPAIDFDWIRYPMVFGYM